jgi:hypothetical protein
MIDKVTKKNGAAVKLHLVALSDVLAKAKVPRRIDYLSFDVEGAELVIAKFFPWSEYDVGIVTVERPRAELRRLLKEVAGLEFLTGLQGLNTVNKYFGELVYARREDIAGHRAKLGVTYSDEAGWLASLPLADQAGLRRAWRTESGHDLDI